MMSQTAMALPPGSPDLAAMPYGFRRSGRPLRENAPSYGSFSDPDRFAGDTVLADLQGAEDPLRVSRIIARYAALRSWLLAAEGMPRRLTRHAADAARAHLEAVAPWAEGALLLELLDADLTRAAALMALAATEAADAEDTAGAQALREGARQAMVLRLRESRRPRESWPRSRPGSGASSRPRSTAGRSRRARCAGRGWIGRKCGRRVRSPTFGDGSGSSAPAAGARAPWTSERAGDHDAVLAVDAQDPDGQRLGADLHGLPDERCMHHVQTAVLP